MILYFKNEDGVTVLSAGGYLNDVDLAVIYESKTTLSLTQDA